MKCKEFFGDTSETVAPVKVLSTSLASDKVNGGFENSADNSVRRWFVQNANPLVLDLSNLEILCGQDGVFLDFALIMMTNKSEAISAIETSRIFRRCKATAKRSSGKVYCISCHLTMGRWLVQWPSGSIKKTPGCAQRIFQPSENSFCWCSFQNRMETCILIVPIGLAQHLFISFRSFTHSDPDVRCSKPNRMVAFYWNTHMLTNMVNSRSILHGYFNPLVFWYQWEYRLTSKEFIFCQVSWPLYTANGWSMGRFMIESSTVLYTVYSMDWFRGKFTGKPHI